MMASPSESPTFFPASNGSDDDWSRLSRSIISMIAGHLNAVDHVRFRAVCCSWRATCKKRPKIPLIIICHLDRYRRLSSLSFFDLVLKQTIPLPAASASASAAVSHLIASNNIYIGSSHGWISFATINQQRPRISLLNPFTSELLNLPELNEIHVSPIKGIRVMLSIPVVVSYSLYPAQLSFMLIGDIGWKTISLLSPLRNVIAFKDRFYCHFYGRNRDKLYLIDMEAEDGNGAIVPVHLDSPDVILSTGEGGLMMISWEFLVEFSGDLHVAAFIRRNNGKILYEFLKVDFENRRLNLLTDDQMGEYQLFLGQSRPVFLRPERYLDYRPDRFHFTESPNVLSVYECHHQSAGRILSLQGHWEDHSGQRRVAVGWITPQLNIR
ncbi:hypothetical protein J5N97_017385 [Dioscorea zingiberensis]|uniref:F-box protein n=1 Tax=Dioscorea zingiberensis TaxID=325984 RepID=A0A9D5HGC1_9LILI|nr:hypothetical protein J5N97_017385 [Dioscorea zingiberensis]